MPQMLDEIREQPGVISRLIDAEREPVAKLAQEIKRRGIRFVMMAARGTSDHAAIYGKYLLEIVNGIPVGLADPSVYTLYSAKIDMSSILVIGISQSGQAPDVIEYLKRSRQAGALAVAITNEPDSPIISAADHTILCHAGSEESVAATKTYTSALAAMYLLSASLVGNGERIGSLRVCADAMQAALSVEPQIADKAERYRYMESGAVISRGFNYCTALETALKLAETNYIGMRGFSAADFLHGPIATVHEGYPCILIAPPGKAYQGMYDMASTLRGRGAETVIFSSDDKILSLATTPIKLGVHIDEVLSPLVYAIPGQLLAYHMAIARGYDPDQPRGLTKVTLTR